MQKGFDCREINRSKERIGDENSRSSFKAGFTSWSLMNVWMFEKENFVFLRVDRRS